MRRAARRLRRALPADSPSRRAAAPDRGRRAPTGIAEPRRASSATSRSGRGEDTLVQRIAPGRRRRPHSTADRGVYTIPAVALDGSPGGLSADGCDAGPDPPAERLPARDDRVPALRDPRSAPIRERVHARRRLQLRRALARRAHDVPDRVPLAAGSDPVPGARLRPRPRRLEPGAIIDPDEAGEEMYGFALSRVTEPEDGRWAYTLYEGSEHPFIHALDTARARRCASTCHSSSRFGHLFPRPRPGPRRRRGPDRDAARAVGGHGGYGDLRGRGSAGGDCCDGGRGGRCSRGPIDLDRPGGGSDRRQAR